MYVGGGKCGCCGPFGFGWLLAGRPLGSAGFCAGRPLGSGGCPLGSAGFCAGRPVGSGGLRRLYNVNGRGACPLGLALGLSLGFGCLGRPLGVGIR